MQNWTPNVVSYELNEPEQGQIVPELSRDDEPSLRSDVDDF